MNRNPLPVEAYTSSEWFDREQREIFGKTWQFGGLVEDVAESGDFVTIQAGPHPLLVLRGPDGELRAFHNICRHRGTQLLRTIGKAKKSIICPYHHWTYSLEGDLKSIPNQSSEFPGVDLKPLCLHRASVEVWRGMFFVHPEPDSAPLGDWLSGVEENLGPHRPGELVEYEDGRTRDEINANWKIVVENYIDGYHLAHLHSETLHMYDHSKQQSGFVGPHFMFYEPLAKSYAENLEQESQLPKIDHVPADQRGAWVPMLFPNIGLTESEASWSIFHVIPVAPDKTIVETRTKVMPVSDWDHLKQTFSSWWNWKGRDRQKFEGGEDDPLSSGDFMKEDIYACEQQQKAMRSPKFAIGPTAKTLECSVFEFHEHVRKCLGDVK
ncbi:MAG: aromatic ring-hydroxylating oxygenase subunit alpha [Limisphaerales bacterium]